MMRKTKFIRVITLLLSAALVLLLATACNNAGGSTTTTGGTNAAATTLMPATTEMPTTTAVPTTPRPTVAIDPSLPYFQQEQTEFEQNFGFSAGDFPFGSDETTCLGKCNYSQVTKSDIDMTGSGLPFTVAKEVVTATVPANWWEASAIRTADKGFQIANGDIYAGCLWVKDPGGENPATVYLAIKTPTDSWSTEGQMSISTVTTTGDWTKVYFYGQSLNDETDSSVIQFQMLLGNQTQTVDIGGLYVEHFPGTDANYAAEMNMPLS